MECEKCGIEIEPYQYTDLFRIEEHHLHPSFMDNFKGLGIKISLCRDCHILKLHPLIFEIIKKYSNHLKKHSCKSWEWVWKYVPGENKEKCINEVKEFTLNWVNKKDGNTKTNTSI